MAGELVDRLNWWGAKRKPPKGMETLPADCREAADRIEALERENATLRAERVSLIEKAAQIAEKTGVYPELNVFGGGPEWYRHGKVIAAAIRNMGGGENES